jgi:peroxiredoxin
LESALPGIKQLNGRLLAISPQLPDQSLAMVEERGLDFDVLSDPGNRVAREFGLAFTMPRELREIYPKFGMDVSAANGEDSYELPVPATYVIHGEGTIVLDFVEIDYTKRLAPPLILEALRGIR